MGRFRQYIEGVNKAMFDLTTPEGRKEYEREVDYFNSIQNRPEKQETHRDRKTDDITITCWTGTNHKQLERQTVDRRSSFRVISGEHTPNNILWFTHNLQGNNLGQDPKEYAIHQSTVYSNDESHPILLTYPLHGVKKHYDLVEYNDGSTAMEHPKEILEKVPGQESPFYVRDDGAIYEVPKGWKFTHQVQKHLICSAGIQISDDMLQFIGQQG